jgi:hypothetical protein
MGKHDGAANFDERDSTILVGLNLFQVSFGRRLP